MEKPPEEIRGEIDDVREDLGDTLEAIGDRVAPKKLMARAKADASERVQGVKAKLGPRRLASRGADTVRQGVRRAVGSGNDSSANGGVSEVAGSARGQGRAVAGAARGQSEAVAKRARGTASSVADSLGDAPQAVRQQAEGNPVAAGLLAFAGGFFAAALLPPTERERQAVQKAKEALQPVAESAGEVGKSVAGELQSTAKASLEVVKETATDAVEEVKGRAQASAEQVKQEASGATEKVAGRAKKATKKVQKQAEGATGAVKGEAKKAAKRVRGEAKKAAPTKKVAPTGAIPRRPVDRPRVVTGPGPRR